MWLDPRGLVLILSPFSCLRCLRNRSCPLCRQSFEERDIRRLHLDKTNLSPGSARQSPSPERLQINELRDNILGLYEPLTSDRLQQNIVDVVFGSITVDGVTERQVQDLLVEIRQFLYCEPSDKVSPIFIDQDIIEVV